MFIDARKAERSESVVQVLLQWGEASGLVEQQVRWEAWSMDDDGDWYYTLHRTAKAAFQCDQVELELSEKDDEALTNLLGTLPDPPGNEDLLRLRVLLPGGPDDAGLVRRVTVPIGTPELKAVTGMGMGVGDRDATGALLVRWVELHGEATLGAPIDGLWWDDMLDVWSLSAPRGLIFRERVLAWSAVQTGR